MAPADTRKDLREERDDLKKDIVEKDRKIQEHRQVRSDMLKGRQPVSVRGFVRELREERGLRKERNELIERRHDIQDDLREDEREREAALKPRPAMRGKGKGKAKHETDTAGKIANAFATYGEVMQAIGGSGGRRSQSGGRSARGRSGGRRNVYDDREPESDSDPFGFSGAVRALGLGGGQEPVRRTRIKVNNVTVSVRHERRRSGGAGSGFFASDNENPFSMNTDASEIFGFNRRGGRGDEGILTL